MTDQPHAPALVVFGRDDAGKPHGSVFVESDAALARKAAAMMAMRVMPIETDSDRALAARLPKGKVFASGKGFVPFIKGALFEELDAACPSTADDTAEGGVVAAEVEKPRPSKAAARSEPQHAEPSRQPSGWAEIPVGSIVLARPSLSNAEWYEALVTAAKADRFTLRLCDFPDRPLIHRRRMEIGLMHPKHQPEPPLEPGSSSDA